MNNDYYQMTDRQLVKLVISRPDNADGKAAKEILEYRKYLTTRRHNFWLILLSILLTCSAILQVIINISSNL